MAKSKSGGKADQLRAMREASAGGDEINVASVRKLIEDAIAPMLQSRNDKLAKLLEERRAVDAEISKVQGEIEQVRAAAGLGSSGKRGTSGGSGGKRSQADSDKRAAEIVRANGKDMPLRELNRQLQSEGYRKVTGEGMRQQGLKNAGTKPHIVIKL